MKPEPSPPTAGDSPELPPLLVLRPLSPPFQAALSARFSLVDPSSASATTARAAIVSGGLTIVDSALLDRYPALRCIVTTSAGVNHIDLGECARRGVGVGNAGTVFSVDVADYAVGLLLGVLRKVTIADRFVKNGLWPIEGDYPLGSRLGGKRVGIVGLGSIGSEIAKRLDSFKCIISYYSRKQKPSASYKYFPNIYNLASDSDILVVSCALTEKTRHIINGDVMRALGKEGIIVNIGRGALIDEPELVRFLMQRELKGAGLDVYENEPNVPKELVAMDNVVLTPHQAVFTHEGLSDLFQLMIANLEAFFSGRPLITPVLE